jgi:hypothetical protein
MSEILLPNSVNYAEPMTTLPPDSQSFQVVGNPVSGSSFGAGSQIDVDLVNRGFLVPDSLMIRFKATTTNAAATYMCGTGAYSPFSRLAVQANSATIESINQYNVLCNMLCNTKLDVSQKLGRQYALGYGNQSTPQTNEDTDGLIFATNDSRYLSAPLPCCLSSAEKLVPLFALNGIRLTFTLDSIANIFSVLDNTGTACALPTDFQITNFEVVYQVVDMGASVERMVLSQPEIRIKSETWGTSVQTVPSGSSGTMNLIYNLKYSSVKSLYLLAGGATRTTSANGNFDSYMLSGDTGDYQFSLGGMNFPQRALSVKNNKGGIIELLRQASGSLYDKNNSMSINSYEFNVKGGINTATVPNAPAKFIVGLNTEKLRLPRGSFFSGTSTEASPITAIVNMATAGTQAYNAILLLNADYILKIDTASRQVSFIQ